jgi:hypothetical protein
VEMLALCPLSVTHGGHLEDVIFRVEWCVFLCSVLCFKTTDSLISANAKVCSSL